MRAIVVDTETTGFTEPVAPIEVAVYDLGESVDKFRKNGPTPVLLNDRFNPGRRIELGAMATHFITDKEVSKKKKWDLNMLPDHMFMIGHSIDFDWKTLGSNSTSLRICTLAMARNLFPDAQHKLGALYLLARGDSSQAEAVEDLKMAHSAVIDAHLTIQVLRFILDQAEQVGFKVGTWGEVYQFSETSRIPTRMPFGKHIGVPIKDVPRDYKGWLLKQKDVDPYLRQALEART